MKKIKFIEEKIRFQKLIQRHHHDYLDFIKLKLKTVVSNFLFIQNCMYLTSLKQYMPNLLSTPGIFSLVQKCLDCRLSLLLEWNFLFQKEWYELEWMLWNYLKTYCKQLLNENLLHIQHLHFLYIIYYRFTFRNIST